jgi:glycosyltransferase involved in cell wall biosynthesis
MNPRRLAVIVATYNRPDALAAVLRGLAAQDDREFEVIVADDGSRDDTRATVDALRPGFPVKLRHVWHPDDGFRLAAIRNKGILTAEADYLVFLDGDCIPQPDFVARHRALAAPGSMVTGSRILLGEALTSRLLADGTDFFSLGILRRLAERRRGGINKLLPLWVKVPAGAHRNIAGFVWRRIKGCNLGAWRSDVLAINGFDESFTGWGHEDADFVLRLFHAGIRRTDGAYATEVLHLWHREAKKDSANSNLETVKRRMATHQVRAERGLDELRGSLWRVD